VFLVCKAVVKDEMHIFGIPLNYLQYFFFLFNQYCPRPVLHYLSAPSTHNYVAPTRLGREHPGDQRKELRHLLDDGVLVIFFDGWRLTSLSQLLHLLLCSDLRGEFAPGIELEAGSVSSDVGESISGLVFEFNPYKPAKDLLLVVVDCRLLHGCSSMCFLEQDLRIQWGWDRWMVDHMGC
jgi:hypothetical protein